MTEDEIFIAKNLNAIHLGFGPSFDKRFIWKMNHNARYDSKLVLSEKQTEWIYRLLYKYREQLPKTYKKYKEHTQCKAKENGNNNNNTA